MRIDSTDHGQPKFHKHGAHKHIIKYDVNGKSHDGELLELTLNDRRENSDIL